MILHKSRRFPFKGLAVFFCVILLSFNSLAQSSDKQQHYELSNALDGMFQFQMIGIRNQPSYDTSLLQEISNKQKQSERVIFYYKGNIRVEILSKDEVQNGVVFSSDEKVIFVNQ